MNYHQHKSFSTKVPFPERELFLGRPRHRSWCPTGWSPWPGRARRSEILSASWIRSPVQKSHKTFTATEESCYETKKKLFWYSGLKLIQKKARFFWTGQFQIGSSSFLLFFHLSVTFRDSSTFCYFRPTQKKNATYTFPAKKKVLNWKKERKRSS